MLSVLKNKITTRVVCTALLFFTLLIALSCKKTNKYKWVYYDETYCSDPWKYHSVNEILKDNIKEYYKKNKDIEIIELEIFSDRETETNSSCSAKTGRRIKSKIHNKELKEIKATGFYE